VCMLPNRKRLWPELTLRCLTWGWPWRHWWPDWKLWVIQLLLLLLVLLLLLLLVELLRVGNRVLEDGAVCHRRHRLLQGDDLTHQNLDTISKRTYFFPEIHGLIRFV
jgi:hypothetical protein